MAKYELDLTHYRCPLPLLATKKALMTLNPNDELWVCLNRDSAIDDFKLLCSELNCTPAIEQATRLIQRLKIRKNN